MSRILGALVALLLFAGLISADEIMGKFKSADTTKNTITITIDAKDKTLALDPSPLVVSDDNKAKGIKGGIGALKAGTDVTLLTDKKDGKDIVTTVKAKMLKKKN